MKFPSRLNKRSGFTLIELAISAGLVATIGLVLSNWIAKPVQMQIALLTIDVKRQADQAANRMVADLQTADPNSIDWNNLSTTQISFNQPQFNYANPSAVLPPTALSFVYQDDGNGDGHITRTAGASQTTLISHVLPPTDSFPLVEHDSSTVNGVPMYNMLILHFAYQPPTIQKPVYITRRIAVTE
jgi:type II secretory pathway pseudopilin PulG